jgi:hypothetical protein
LIHIWSYKWNLSAIQVGLETRHLKLEFKTENLQERMMCFKSGLEIYQENAKIGDSGYMEEF